MYIVNALLHNLFRCRLAFFALACFALAFLALALFALASFALFPAEKSVEERGKDVNTTLQFWAIFEPEAAFLPYELDLSSGYKPQARTP